MTLSGALEKEEVKEAAEKVAYKQHSIVETRFY
jgi:hypothetical protein